MRKITYEEQIITAGRDLDALMLFDPAPLDARKARRLRQGQGRALALMRRGIEAGEIPAAAADAIEAGWRKQTDWLAGHWEHDEPVTKAPYRQIARRHLTGSGRLH